MEMIQCIKCKGDMPKLRFEKFGYKKCVRCSDTSPYRVINTVNGTGDHTWNDIQIVTQEQYEQYQGLNTPNFDRIEENKEDNNLQGPLTIINPD